MVVNVSVGIHIKRIAVANFHIGSVKKVYVVCYEEENAYLKDLKLVCQFSFLSLCWMVEWTIVVFHFVFFY